MDGKKYFYIPDFKIGDQLIEIKGGQFFDKKDNFVIPYESNSKTKANAKYNCMLSHNVLILKDVKKQLKYVKDKYGPDYLNQFRSK